MTNLHPDVMTTLVNNFVTCPWCGHQFNPASPCTCRVQNALNTPLQRKVSALQEQFKKLPQVNCPLTHEFTADFYVRTIFVPAGSLVISRMFKAEFPFFISKGRVSVAVEGKDGKFIIVHRQAPCWGFTEVGARRIIMHHTDVKWTTFHPNPSALHDIAALESEVIYDPEKDLPKDIPMEIVKELQRA